MIISGRAIYAALLDDTAVVAAVDTVGTDPCIAVDNRAPRAWDAKDITITIYSVGVMDDRLNYSDQPWTANCRAATYEDSQDLAALVVAALNRKSHDIEGVFYCQRLATIQPADKDDNYNSPVEIQVKRRA